MPIAAFASLAFAATPALADTVALTPASVGTSFTIGYDGNVGGTTVAGLSGSSTFALTGVSGNDYTFSYSVTNTSSTPITSRISSFALDTNPNITGATSTGAFSFTTLNSSYPNGVGSVDVCFKDAATGSCAGGGGGGLDTGQTGTGTFTLSFASPVTALDLSNFAIRYQSITGTNLGTSGTGSGTVSSTSSTSGGTDVPEPGVVGLLGGAVIALALTRRRRRPDYASGPLPAAAYA